MHFAGLSAMARRIPEYADIFLPSVIVGTTGTLLLFISVIILLRSFFFCWSNPIFANYF